TRRSSDLSPPRGWQLPGVLTLRRRAARHPRHAPEERPGTRLLISTRPAGPTDGRTVRLTGSVATQVGDKAVGPGETEAVRPGGPGPVRPAGLEPVRSGGPVVAAGGGPVPVAVRFAIPVVIRPERRKLRKPLRRLRKHLPHGFETTGRETGRRQFGDHVDR